MCNLKSWFFDDSGYVIECMECKHLRIFFGNMLLTLEKKDYQDFFKLVSRKKQKHIPMHDADAKCIVLATPSKSVQVILNENELNDLYTMLQSADVEMITQQLLDLFIDNKA